MPRSARASPVAATTIARRRRARRPALTAVMPFTGGIRPVWSSCGSTSRLNRSRLTSTEPWHAQRLAGAAVEEHGRHALADDRDRIAVGDQQRRVEQVAAAGEADGAAFGADLVDRRLDGERAGCVALGGDADGAAAAFGLELGRPEGPAVEHRARKAHDGEAGVVALDALGRGVAQRLDLGAGGAGGEPPVVHLAVAAGAVGGGEGDGDAGLEEDGAAVGRHRDQAVGARGVEVGPFAVVGEPDDAATGPSGSGGCGGRRGCRRRRPRG